MVVSYIIFGIFGPALSVLIFKLTYCHARKDQLCLGSIDMQQNTTLLHEKKNRLNGLYCPSGRLLFTSSISATMAGYDFEV